MNTIDSFMSDDKALPIFLFITIILARAADISIHCATKGTFNLDHKKLFCYLYKFKSFHSQEKERNKYQLLLNY